MSLIAFYKRQYEHGKGYHEVKVYASYSVSTGCDNLLHTFRCKTQVGMLRELSKYKAEDGRILTRTQIKITKEIMKLHIDGVVTEHGAYYNN